jgi:tRNA nucleotidyltransferase (CCA-adding enzyme)
LRLLRIARFAARFPEFRVADATMTALKAIVQSGELNALSAERIWQELARGLVASKPIHLFQVLLNTGAAKTILPASLGTSLAEELFREELITHYESAGNNLEERCAITLMHLPVSEIRSWADGVRMPIEVRDFCEIFAQLRDVMNQFPNGKFQAVDILAWFNRADIWRKPDRGLALLNLGQKLGMPVSSFIAAMRNAQAINTAEIIAGIEAQDRSNGERIGGAFESARLAAIAQALQV